MNKKSVKKLQVNDSTEAPSKVEKLELRRVIGGAGRTLAVRSVGAKAASCTETY
jgi:hypothetical protein